ncbi:MAG: FtsX-like permease family protein [Bacteroidetes bacterium]|nr:MAG: FtsX-like permease family protein [Bacteroidota bacterium]
MNWNYLKIAWRILLKNLKYTVINVAGLGLGFSVSVLLIVFVFHQLSFDRFHEKSDRIYRVTLHGSMADGKLLSAAFTSGDIASYIADEVPEAELVCRVYNWGAMEVIAQEKRFADNKLLWVDSTFFDIFTFPLLKGHPEHALKEPNSVVLTQSAANKFFGDEDPMKQTLRIRGDTYQVTGLMPDPPSTSHLQFDMLAAFHSLETQEFNIIQNSGISFPTYILKREGADSDVLREKASHVADHYFNERFHLIGMSGTHSLQPLNRIYLHSGFGFDTAVTGDIQHIYVLSFLALAVIVIAVFNFVNLVTAQSEKRMREIGMRKVMGAIRKDLTLQFIGESVLMAFMAFLLSLGLNEILINEFSFLLDENLRLEYWYHPGLLLSIVSMVLITGILAGLYPALYLSGFQPIAVLKGLTKSSLASQLIRKVLVIFQFSISIFLITTVLLLNRQVDYMQSKDLGFGRENLVSVRGLTQNIRNAYPALRSELLQHPSITHVAASHEVPGENMSLQNSRKTEDPPQSAIMMYENRIQHGYLETLGIRIVEGRDFDPEMGTDRSAIILNETGVRKLGLENPIGEEIVLWEHTGKIIGVVADFNFMSLHNEIDPIAFTVHDNWISRINIRMLPGNTRNTLDWIKEQLEKTDSNYTFEYFFVDDLFAQMYQREEHLNRLTLAAAIIAIIISFMGLFALTSFTIQKRIKEIGIRKTLGASLPQILGLLFRDMWRWIVIGCLVAWPFSVYVIARWQENFAYRITIADHWYLFLIAGILAAMVGTIATFTQAWGASKTNPIESLKTE